MSFMENIIGRHKEMVRLLNVNPKENATVQKAVNPDKALSHPEKHNLNVVQQRQNPLEKSLKTPEERKELNYQNDLKAQLREEKDEQMRKRMGEFLVRQGYLSQVQVDEVLKEESTIKRKVLEEIYNDLGNQRKLADMAVKVSNVSQEEVENTLVRSVSDYIVQEYVIRTQDSARTLLTWFRSKKIFGNNDSGYKKVEDALKAAIVKWSKSSATAQKAEVADKLAKRMTRVNKSESFLYPPVMFKLSRAEKILLDQRKRHKSNTPVTKSILMCGEGASDIFYDSTGIRIGAHGYQWADEMRKMIKFKEFAYTESFDPKHKSAAPDNSMLVWDRLPERLAAGLPTFGHVAWIIEDHEVSDFITKRGLQRTDKLPDYVFTPIG